MILFKEKSERFFKFQGNLQLGGNAFYYTQKLGKIDFMRWPSQFPDLNPVESVWDRIDGLIKSQNYGDLGELFDRVEND